MSVKNGKDYIYLIWKSDLTRRQYIVGQLSKNGQYEFQYYGEFKEAQEAGFTLLILFSSTEKVYQSKELFSVFKSRLPDRKRKDIDKILNKYGLESYDSYELLKRSGARLPIDNLQFIDPIMDIESAFERKFYVAGVRHYVGCEGEDCNKSADVTLGEKVFFEREQTNIHDRNAVKVIRKNGEIIGYVPRFYSEAFSRMIIEGRNINCVIADIDKNKCCSECIMLAVSVE